jgi:hypothetical protein
VTDLLGLPIKLERTIDGPCAVCGETAVIIGAGAGLHVALLRCACCDRHRGWLPKTVADFLIKLIEQFGRPTEPITIRNSELAASLGAPVAEASMAPSIGTDHE